MKKILIIEDDEFIREIISMSLQIHDYHTIEAENGSEGFRKAKLYKPDLILSDIMMPIMDGFEALTMVREDKQTSEIPFIFLTAITSPSSKRLSEELGANGYLLKPFNLSELLKVIEEQLKVINLPKNLPVKKLENKSPEGSVINPEAEHRAVLNTNKNTD